MRGAKRARGDQGGAGAGQAGDAVDAGGLQGFGQGHGGQDGGEPVRQHRLARPGGASNRTLGSQRLHPLQPRHVPVERSRQGGLNWKGP
jgi:hypothetical protein